MVIHVYLPHKHKWKGITSTVTYLITNYSVWGYGIFCKNCYITSWFNFRSKMFRIFIWLILMQMCTFDTLMECSIRWRYFLKYWFCFWLYRFVLSFLLSFFFKSCKYISNTFLIDFYFYKSFLLYTLAVNTSKLCIISVLICR